MKQRLTVEEWRELVAMNTIEPIGFDRLDWYASHLLAAWGDGKPADFDLSLRRRLFEGEDDFDINADMRTLGAI